MICVSGVSWNDWPESHRRIDWSILITRLNYTLSVLKLLNECFFGAQVISVAYELLILHLWCFLLLHAFHIPWYPHWNILNYAVKITSKMTIEVGRKRKRPSDVVETTSNGGVWTSNRALWGATGQFRTNPKKNPLWLSCIMVIGDISYINIYIYNIYIIYIYNIYIYTSQSYNQFMG